MTRAPARGPARRSSARTWDAAGLADAVAEWFSAAARPLPWRTTPRDPYRSLVSEFMLQQTQVSRVIDKFALFVGRFPTLDSLARANESDVLAAWSGLGYYRRAKLLHAAARAIRSEHAGTVPSDTGVLRSIPGIGRYTAGAIASIVFDRAAPIVDGNVMRVLLRVSARRGSADDAAAIAWVWGRAAAIAEAAASPARTNEGLMELGATVCTPRAPACGSCPLARRCVARRRGLAEVIPKPKSRARTKRLRCACVVVTDASGRLLAVPRPPRGLWASMWQVPTKEAADDGGALDNASGIASWLVESYRLAPRRVRKTDEFEYRTTHREIRATVWTAAARAPGGAIAGARWVTREEFLRLGVSNFQRRMIGERPA